MTKTALIGLHDYVLKENVEALAEIRGYYVKVIDTFEEMEAQAQAKDYDRYLMDANFGHSGSPDVTPSETIWNLPQVKERVERGEAKFIAVSSGLKTIENATEKGIPAEDTFWAIREYESFFD